MVYYYLKSAPKEEVKLEILDGQGAVVKTYSSVKKDEDSGPAEWPDVQHLSETLPVAEGLNRFAWNLRYEDPVKVPGNFYETDIPPKGPMALPGAYQVRLTVAGQSQTAPLELRKDPRFDVSQADLEKQFDLERQIARRLTALHNTVNGIRELRSQVNGLEQRYKNATGWQAVKPLADELVKKMTAVEEKIIQTKMKSTEGDLRYPTMIDEQLIALNWSVDATDTAPSEGQQQLFADLSAKLQEQLVAWDGIMSHDLISLNRTAEEKKLTLVGIPPK
jgi:hypothetical protein